MRYLGVSSTVLALLIALISVSQSAVPVFVKVMKGQYTNLRVNLLSIEDTTATVLVTNSGSMPGRLGEVWIDVDFATAPFFNIAYTHPPGLINPGEMREVSLLITSADPDESNECDEARYPSGGFRGYISTVLIGYDGKTSKQEMEVSIHCRGRWAFVPAAQAGRAFQR